MNTDQGQIELKLEEGGTLFWDTVFLIVSIGVWNYCRRSQSYDLFQ